MMETPSSRSASSPSLVVRGKSSSALRLSKATGQWMRYSWEENLLGSGSRPVLCLMTAYIEIVQIQLLQSLIECLFDIFGAMRAVDTRVLALETRES